MGAGPAASNGNEGSDAFVNKKSKVKKVERTKFGYTKPKNKFETFLEDGGTVGAVTKPFRDATEEVNRKFYEEKVVPAGKSKAPNYETYMKDRLAGKTDAYGNPTPNQGGGNNNNNQPVKPVIVKKNIGGTEVQTTEAKLAEEKAADDEYDMRKTKRRGRRQTILTSQTGARGNLVLGKPSLLGA